MDFTRIKEAAVNRCGEIIESLTPLPREVTETRGQDQPCPLCDGKSVIWSDKRDGGANAHGSIACRNCTDNKPTGDIIATVAAFTGIEQGEAAKQIAAYIGIETGSGAKFEPPDIIEQVAKAKRMPVDAFRQFEPVAAKRGRDRSPVARVPVWGADGIVHSHFDMTPTDKGFFKRGEGNSGLFLPGRLPIEGETWHLVEGVKDAAALLGNGYQSCGLPSSFLAAKFAELFRGVHVITVADLDEPGQNGAARTGGNLIGIAASVKVARLPGEIKRTGGADVRDVISREGPDAVKAAIEGASPWQPREGQQRGDDRPEIALTLAYARHVDQALQCIGRLGWETPWLPEAKRESRRIYQRDGLLVRIVEEVRTDATAKGSKLTIEKGTPRIKTLPIQQLPLRIADACQLVTEVEKDGEIETKATPPPRWLVDGMFSHGDYGDAIRPLEGIVTAPTIRVDGSILQRAGWDQRTGLVYRPSMQFDPVPDKPAKADAVDAAQRLLAVVKDFPFADDADRSAWLTMVLSMIGRPCIAGQVPLFAITANIRGAGKSLLVDAAAIIAYGHAAARTPYSDKSAEMGKTITSVAIEAAPAVMLDNIDRSFGCAPLDAVLTGGRWKDRELGHSRTVDLPMRTIWAATGNNLTFIGDLARRVLPIRLDSPEESPEDRTDFDHADLLGWTRDNRASLVADALTIIRGFFAADCPAPDSATWGSFESWVTTIRGAVMWSGLADPLPTRETAKEDDESAGIVRGLIGGLIEMDEGGGVSTSEIVRNLEDPERYAAMRNAVAELMSKPDARKLGYQFRKYRDRVASGFRIKSQVGHDKTNRWYVAQAYVTAAAEKESGDGGHQGDDSTRARFETCCVTHATDGDTQHVSIRGAMKTCPASPPSPDCPKCGGVTVPAPIVGQWQNFDCSECGHVVPVKLQGEA